MKKHNSQANIIREELASIDYTPQQDRFNATLQIKSKSLAENLATILHKEFDYR